MNGAKTILTLIVGAFVVPFFAKYGTAMTPDQQLEVVAGGMAALGVVMRFLSNGPALADLKAWLAAKAAAKPTVVVPTTPDVNQLADAVLAVLQARAAAKKAAVSASVSVQSTNEVPKV